MKKSIFTEFLLYRYRYILGYGLFIVALINLLVIAGIAIPGALTQREMQSAVASATMPLQSLFAMPIIDLPYHLLQKASIAVLGLTPLGIKLPSLLLAFATAIAFMFLLRRWFPRNVAILTAIVAVTGSQFLVVSQSGTPTIMLLFWPTFMLLAATGVSAATRASFLWKLFFFSLAALSLYTPLSVYILLVMVLAAASHPHLRFMVRRLSPLRLAVCLSLFAILLIPLVLHLVQYPGTIKTLLGLPNTIPSLATLWENAQFLSHAFTGFMDTRLGPEYFLPMYGIAALALILFGLMRLIVDHHSARTYTIGIWSLVMSIILLLQPEEYLSVAFIPILLMLAIGIATLIREWYDLFPLNPYARAAALVLLVILMGGVVYGGVDRYTNSYRYGDGLALYFNNDLQLIRNELKLHAGQPVQLIVAPQNQAFYKLLERKQPLLKVSTSYDKTAGDAIVAIDAKKQKLPPKTPSRLLVNSYKQDALRFYLYKTN